MRNVSGYVHVVRENVYGTKTLSLKLRERLDRIQSSRGNICVTTDDGIKYC
jgi:hypothetical protein